MKRVPKDDRHYNMIVSHVEKLTGRLNLKTISQKHAKRIFENDPVLALPYELNCMVFGHLQLSDILQCCLVRKSWYHFVTGEMTLWKIINLKNRQTRVVLVPSIIARGGVFLKELNLGYVKVALQSVTGAISQTRNLESFTWKAYQGCPSSQVASDFFSKLLCKARLTKLDLSESAFSNHDMNIMLKCGEGLVGSISLSNLALSHCPNLSQKPYRHDAKSSIRYEKLLGGLTNLDLSHTNLQHFGPVYNLNLCKNLETLNVSYSECNLVILCTLYSNSKLKDFQFKKKPGFLPHDEVQNYENLWLMFHGNATCKKDLISLSVGGHPFSDESLSLLLNEYPNISFLDISHCGWGNRRLSNRFLSDASYLKL